MAGHLEALGGHIAGEAADIATGVRAAAALAPDVIVVDGRLPGGGPTAVAALRAAAPQAAIVAVVALQETALAQRLRDAGGNGVLLRPYLRSRVAAVLQAVAPPP